MNQTFLKAVLRVIGALSGVMGVAGLFYIPIFLARNDVPAVVAVLMLLPLLFAGYFVYVGYLVWFKLSPLAVRHACGLIGFYVLTLFMELLDSSHDSLSPWKSFAFLGCLIAVYFGYKAASRWLSRQLFPEPSPDVQI